MSEDKPNNDVQPENYNEANIDEVLDESVISVFDLLYGWVPFFGFPIALVNYLQGKKRRAKYFFIASCIGLVVLPILMYFF